MIIILMGVCGCGKTTVGKALAKKLQWQFADADEFHSAENKLKMSSGQPLTDQDRLPWLLNIHEYIRSEIANGQSSVVTCSALKKYYRQILLHGQTVVPRSGAVCLETSQQGDLADKLLRESNARVAKGEQLGISREENSDSSSKGEGVIFVHLSGAYAVLEKRLASREGHFMPGSLLQSQLETLTPPDQDENSVTVDIDKTVDEIVDEIIQRLSLTPGKST